MNPELWTNCGAFEILNGICGSEVPRCRSDSDLKCELISHSHKQWLKSGMDKRTQNGRKANPGPSPEDLILNDQAEKDEHAETDKCSSQFRSSGECSLSFYLVSSRAFSLPYCPLHSLLALFFLSLWLHSALPRTLTALHLPLPLFLLLFLMNSYTSTKVYLKCQDFHKALL